MLNERYRCLMTLEVKDDRKIYPDIKIIPIVYKASLKDRWLVFRKLGIFKFIQLWNFERRKSKKGRGNE